MNNKYEFVLVLGGINSLSLDQEAALFDAGCDDSTVGLQNGQVHLMFTREAKDLAVAIASAVEDVNKAKIGVEIVRIDLIQRTT